VIRNVLLVLLCKLSTLMQW